MLALCILPSYIWLKVEIEPRKSSNVCNLTAAFVVRKWAQGKRKDRGLLWWYREYIPYCRFRCRVVYIKFPCNLNKKLSKVGVYTPVINLLAIANVLREIPPRIPMW